MNDMLEFFASVYKDKYPNATDEQIIIEYNHFVNHVNRLALEYANSPYYKHDRISRPTTTELG